MVASENGRMMLRNAIREDAPTLAHETLDEACELLEELCTRKTGVVMAEVGGA